MNFRELAQRMGLKPILANWILTQLLRSVDKVMLMVQDSFLGKETKEKYIAAYKDKIHRMGMTADMIAEVINASYPGVYAPTTATAPVRLTFVDNKK